MSVDFMGPVTIRKVVVLVAAIWICGLYLCVISMDKKDDSHTQEMREEFTKPLLKFGVFADVQYSNNDNRKNYEQTSWRYYRDSKEKIKEMVNIWNHDDPVEFLLNLGDLIDGQAKRTGESEKCLTDILNCLNDFSGPVYHTWGNHDFYNFKRERLMKHNDLNSPNAVKNHQLKLDGMFHSTKGKAYYSVIPHPLLRIIVLDEYEFSALGRDKDDKVYNKALALLKSKNRNEDLNDSTGLAGPDRRFVLYNGAPTVPQLIWLESQIRDAKNKKQWVIVAGHVPVRAEPAKDYCLLWNYKEVVEVLHRHNNVIMYLAGHDHDGAYAIDDKGIHHLTMSGLVEGKPGTLDYATVELHSSELHVKGSGRIPSIVIDLPDL